MVEFIVAVAMGVLVMAVVVQLTTFSTYSFVALTNYQDLDDQSRNTMDTVCRDLRQATAVMAMATNSTGITLTLTNGNQGVAYTLSWNTNTQVFTYKNSALGAQASLKGCDSWNFSLFQRTPQISATNILFYPATNNLGQLTLSLSKLVEMSWHCSRTIFGKKVNTESVQTAQIVLRNMAD